MNKIEKDLIRVLSDSFITSSKKLNTLLNSEVEILFDSVNIIEDIDSVSEMFDKVVVMQNTFKLGELYTNLPSSCASPLAELMMSGEVEGGNNEMGDLKEKAITEIFSQLMEGYSEELSRELYQNFSVKVAKTVYAKDFEKSKSLMPAVLKGAVVITYRVNFTRVAKDVIRQVIPIELFQQMLELIKPDLDTDEELIKMQEPNFDEDNSIMVQPVQFPTFDNQTSMQLEGNKNFNLLLDIKLKLTVELGRAELPIKRVLELTRGSIIELDKIAGEPVELFANGKLVARGEVVVIEDNFGLRITNIISPDERIKNL